MAAGLPSASGAAHGAAVGSCGTGLCSHFETWSGQSFVSLPFVFAAPSCEQAARTRAAPRALDSPALVLPLPFVAALWRDITSLSWKPLGLMVGGKGRRELRLPS